MLRPYYTTQLLSQSKCLEQQSREKRGSSELNEHYVSSPALLSELISFVSPLLRLRLLKLVLGLSHIPPLIFKDVSKYVGLWVLASKSTDSSTAQV